MTKSAEIVSEALRLLHLGASKQAVAKQLGISTHAVRNWSLRNPGQLLEERVQAGDHDPATCPLIGDLPGREYAYLLGQYLGDGSITRHRRDVYRLVISCCDWYPEIAHRCEAAMLAVLSNKVGTRMRRGCILVSSYSKHWPCLFPQHGAGKKHDRSIMLADWQQTIATSHVREFLGGLFDSDGSRVINRVTRPLKGGPKTYEYPRYFFTNHSQDILEICTGALDQLGVEWRRNRWKEISVAKKASVALLDEFIGPKA